MIIKDIAKETIDNLPNEATYNDIIYALYVKSKFEQGMDEIKNGNYLTQDEVKSRLDKWLK
jgi:hypothetical protein